MYTDQHDTRDETLITRKPVHVELSASALAATKTYKAPLIVRAIRWAISPFTENFDHDRRGTRDPRQATRERRQGERRGASDVPRRKKDR